MDGINAKVKGTSSDTNLISLLWILEKITNWENSSLTSHDTRGFQLLPNGLKCERKWYGES